MNKILFLGSDKFGIPTLKMLIDHDYQIVGIVTQPDRPFGRKKLPKATDIKEFFFNNELDKKSKLFQPEKIKNEYQKILAETNPDIVIVIAYGQILPLGFIESTKFGCYNLHGSLLPSHRGAIPIEKALLMGDKITGVSILKMTENLDDGAVIAESEIPILPSDNAISLRHKLSIVGANLFKENISKILQDLAVGTDQDLLAQKYGRKLSICNTSELSHENGEIVPDSNIESAFNKIRAFCNSGGAWVKIFKSGKPIKLKIFTTEIYDKNSQKYNWGKCKQIGHELGLFLSGGILKLGEIQLEGKKRLSSSKYLYLAEDTEMSSRALILFKDEVLIFKRFKKGEHYIVLPGGHIKKGETPIEAVIREVKEETDIDLTKLEVSEIFIDTLLNSDVTFYFLINLKTKPEVRMLGEETVRETIDNRFKLDWIKLDSHYWTMFKPDYLSKKLRNLASFI